MNNGFSRIFKIYFKYLVNTSILKISVLVPIYNVEKYCIQCLESIKNQTFTDFECIIIDDNSTDNSYSLVKNYIENNDRFKLYQIKHSGLSVVRNTGIDLAKGEYIYFCDSDDFLYPELLEKAYDFITKNDLDMIFFNGDVINDTGLKSQYSRERYYFSRRNKTELIMSGEDYYNYAIYNNKFNAMNYLQLIKKDKIFYRFYPGIYSQNELYTIENMILQEKIGYLPETLYCKRTRNNSSVNCNTKYEHLLSYYIIMKQLIEYKITHNFEKRTNYHLDKVINQIPSLIKILYKRLNDIEKEKLTPEIQSIIGK